MDPSAGEMSDEELMAAFQQGDEKAFTELVRRFKDPLTNFTFRYVGDWDDSYDVVQETFIRVYRSKHTYKPIARLSTWIYTICLNLSRTLLRRRKIRRTFRLSRASEGGVSIVSIEEEIVDSGPQPDRVTESSIMEERIQEALGELDVKFREVVVLRDIQELSYEEIASITGLNMGTVKSRINRGRADLQERLKDYLDN